MALLRAAVRSAELSVGADAANFWMRFSDDGITDTDKQTEDPAMLLASMRHRIGVLGGRIELSNGEAGATVVTVWMPLRRARTTTDN